MSDDTVPGVVARRSTFLGCLFGALVMTTALVIDLIVWRLRPDGTVGYAWWGCVVAVITVVVTSQMARASKVIYRSVARDHGQGVTYSSSAAGAVTEMVCVVPEHGHLTPISARVCWHATEVRRLTAELAAFPPPMVDVELGESRF